MTARLPTPAEVLNAMSQAVREIEDETGLLIPTRALHERVCDILYRRSNKTETDNAA